MGGQGRARVERTDFVPFARLERAPNQNPAESEAIPPPRAIFRREESPEPESSRERSRLRSEGGKRHCREGQSR